jgi:hypothetical protein
VTSFDAAAVLAVRRRAQAAVDTSAEPPPGWSKSTTDPNAVLGAFAPHLRLRPGCELRAYQLVYGHGARHGAGNGLGLVWAVPRGSAWTEPHDCLEPTRGRGARPRPLGATEPMSAVVGDGSAWSRLCASIAARELREIGALWHGLAWTDEFVLDRPPADDDLVAKACREVLTDVEEEWTWSEDPPLDWRPRVDVTKDRVDVEFHTFSLRGRQTITRHSDTYGSDDWEPQQSTAVIATGRFGMQL